MAASCCGGRFDVFLQTWIHEPGCYKRQVGSNREVARRQMEEGRHDAFKPSGSTNPSHRLGKELEERERIERMVPIVGGRRRRGRLL